MIRGKDEYPTPEEWLAKPRVMSDKEAKKRIARVYLGQCEVEGCEGRAVAYHAACAWRLCTKHAAEHAKRTRE